MVEIFTRLRIGRFIHLVVFLLVVVPMAVQSSDLSEDDLRVFHRGWGTWIELDDEYEGFEDKLPEPIERREYSLGTVPIDSMIDLEFEDTVITIYVVLNNVWRLITQSPEAITPRGIVVGSGRGSVRSAYGDPWRTEDGEGRGAYQYRRRTTADPFHWSWLVLTFTFNDDDRVSSIGLSSLPSDIP
jgi:hypothetical protein